VDAADLAGEQKKAQERGQTIAFVDESDFYRLPSVVRTWAPAGQTPVARGSLRRLHLSVISAAIPDGRLYLTMKDKAYTAPDVVLFLKHLLALIPGELVVIWDGSNIHRGPVVEEFLATAQGQRITTNQLPGYAPELNPDEWVWKHLKRVGLRNLSCPGLDDLRKALRRAVVRLQRRQHVVAAFVQHVYGV